MDLHIKAEVFCGEKSCGRVICVIIEPINEKVTHLVVKENSFPYLERLVALKYVAEADSEKIILDCLPEELSIMENFVEYEFIPGASPIFGYNSGEFLMTGLSMMELEHEQIPAGELAVRHGEKVFAKNGRVGKVDDFLLDSKSGGRITHIVLREGHLWAAKNITVPVSAIKRIDDEGIHLSLSTEEIESLPSLKARGWFD